MRNIKNKLTLALAVLLVVTLCIGSMAYFTDRIADQVQVSTIDNAVDIVVKPDPSATPDDPKKDPSTYTDLTPNDPSDDLSNWWAYLNSVANVNYNPGDVMDLSYILHNAGKLDVKVRETFIIKSSVAMTDNSEEFKLCTGYEAYTYGGSVASKYTGMDFNKISSTKYKVVVAESTVASGDSANKNYYLVFAPTAGNNYQGATVTISYVVEAMQSDGDWTTVVTGQITVDGENLNVVPEA